MFASKHVMRNWKRSRLRLWHSSDIFPRGEHAPGPPSKCVFSNCLQARPWWHSSVCNISPSILRRIYYSVVLPKALYACELWNTYSASDILRLERVHGYCVKHIYGLFTPTSTLFAFTCLCTVRIETLIEYRKLTLLGQLCRLENDYLCKIVFVNRLVRYHHGDRQSTGFIPDICSLLVRYSLLDHLTRFLSTGHFPSKYSWKRILNHWITNRVVICISPLWKIVQIKTEFCYNHCEMC